MRIKAETINSGTSGMIGKKHNYGTGPRPVPFFIMSQGKLRILLIFSFISGAFLFINFTTDDPFISYRYAENLASGYGLVFNKGEWVEGFSNPTWVFILSLISFAIPDNDITRSFGSQKCSVLS